MFTVATFRWQFQLCRSLCVLMSKLRKFVFHWISHDREMIRWLHSQLWRLNIFRPAASSSSGPQMIAEDKIAKSDRSGSPQFLWHNNQETENSFTFSPSGMDFYFIYYICIYVFIYISIFFVNISQEFFYSFKSQLEKTVSYCKLCCFN